MYRQKIQSGVTKVKIVRSQTQFTESNGLFALVTKTSGLNSKTVTENLFSDTNLFALFIRIMHRQSQKDL